MKTAAFVLVLLVSFSSSASADDFVVNSTRDAVDAMPGDGVCSTGRTLAGGAAECTLRAAVQEANARRYAIPHTHQIHLPAGVYRLEIPPVVYEEDQQHVGGGTSAFNVQGGDLDIDTDLTITGAGRGVTIVDGVGFDRVFDVWQHHSRQVSFAQLTIRNGVTHGPGGCINHRGGSGNGVLLFAMDVENCVSEEVGGGMFSRGFTEMVWVTFRGNTANRGGGFENSGSAMIDDSTFDGNLARFSQGLPGLGGGISNISAHGAAPWIVIRNSTISNNTAYEAGGLLNHGSVSFNNSTISGNAGSRAGGIAFLDAPTPEGRGTEALYLRFTTIANNQGLGVLRETAGELLVAHTIIAGNAGKSGPANCEGGLTTSSYNLEDRATCGFTSPGDMSGTDPLLGPLANNGGRSFTHALTPASPAIDAGLPRRSVAESRDQRGTPRPLGPLSDIGAYEYGFDPGQRIIALPLRWEHVFRGGLTTAVTFSASFSLRSFGGSRSTPARIIGVKPADGQGELQYQLDKSGRRLKVSGVAVPLKAGVQANQASPVLFNLILEQPLRGVALLWIDSATCDCGARPRKLPIVIPPYKPVDK